MVCVCGGGLLTRVWTIIKKENSLQTEECQVNWGLGGGDAGQVKSGGGGDVLRRMSLLTHR